MQKEVEAWAERVQDTNNKNFVEAECSKPYSTQDHNKKVGRWRENMSLEEVIMALPLVQDGAANFNYRLPDLEETTNLQ